MPKTTFYTFLQTKHQEENADPTDANYPLFPQEVEIRTITPPFPWKILKTLTIDELRDAAKFHIPLAQVEDNVLGTLSQDDLRRANLVIREVQTKVKDLDTNTVHDVKLWKYPHEDTFNMRRCWIEGFVKRRRLTVGMVVGLYWSVEDKMFHFSVLE